MTFWQRNHVGPASLARIGFESVLRPGENEHVLSRLLRERGGDEKWADTMVAEIEHQRCMTCNRSTSPAIMRTYAQVRKAMNATSELAEALRYAIEQARPAQEAMSEAGGMSDADKDALAIQYLARRRGVPEAVMLAAVDGAAAQRVSAAEVLEARQTNGNGPSRPDRGRNGSSHMEG